MASTVTSGPGGAIRLRTIALEDPWTWLAAGWRDLWRRPDIGLSYGAAFTLVSWAITATLLFFDAAYLLLPLAAAFMLVGPMLAVGLYEASRRMQAGQPLTIGAVAFVATRSPGQLAWLGLVLMLFLLAWIRIATIIVALFFGRDLPPLTELFPALFFTVQGLSFLVFGTVVGALLAFAVFAISAISVPLLMVREVDVITAVITSVDAVKLNFWPMMLWAWLIALLTGVGLVTLFFGLILTFPLIGHATWHAFRALVEDEPA